ncbi:MAG: dephospho-CoA kinase [Clostridia bacterium]|nr:dephospho-CoA kinase [Clostridia bacterium]MBR3862025.1 dephospho-CoA kinase [Clostridia bacterium]
MQVIGLTGSSGAGKSVAASIFKKHGIPVIDADCVYHEILGAGGECTKELAEAFGTAVLDQYGLISRQALADTVFGKPNTDTLLHTLNTITHKYVMSEIKKRLRELKENGAKAAVIDAPLLFEANAHLECDFVIGVIADRALRAERIMARDRISRERTEKRLNAQKSDAFFLERCHYILENNTDEAALEQSLLALLIKTGVL